NGGVRASLINDGSGQPHRLVLTARKSGTEAAVSSISFGGDLGGGLQLDTATRIAGQNARLTVNGIQVESAGNRVEGAVQGVTLNPVAGALH
ncbi:flagellar hook protein, partial [Ectothiorhodospira shaposhnikovii]|nr:flagellar hook protein [Ectothiorhodospira shaposhnikovii]